MADAKQAKSQTPLLEWVAATIGLIFLAFLLIVIGHDALTGDSIEQPSVKVMVRSVAPAAGGYVVDFDVVNERGGTAAALTIEGELRAGDDVLETSAATIDYLPGHGKAAGGLFFTHDPRRKALQVRPVGFQTP
jgi:uncharacterized protein (TIGR02588 family)